MNSYDLYVAAWHFALLYLTFIVLAGLFGTFGRTSRQNRRMYLFAVLSILFILMAFRSGNMGNDTKAYVEMFDRISLAKNPFDYIAVSHTEPGFIMYSWLLSRITSDARILFVISSFLIILSIGRFSEKYINNLGMFYCLFIGTLCFDFFLSGLRNALSIAFFLYSIDYLLERKPLPYYAICILALLFHNTAVVYFVLYPLCSPKILSTQRKLITNIGLVVAAFMSSFFFQYMVDIFLKLFPKYTYYVGKAVFDGEPRLAIVLKIIICALLIIVPKLVRKQTSTDASTECLGKRMAILQLLIMIVAFNATAFMRIATVLQIFTLMQFSNEVGRMRTGSSNKIVLNTCTLVAFMIYGLVVVVFRTPEWQTTYPINFSWSL